MQLRNSLPLDDYIIGRLLTFLPSFSELSAMILASKSFYAVFEAHPNSVIRAVAYNAVGPALPQALRVLRSHPPDDENSTQQWSEADPLSPITSHEICELIANAGVVEGLEDLISSRHKDRKYQTSQLNPTESFKFCRAVYRWMLFSTVFPLHILELYVEPIEEDVEEIRLARKVFLSQFSDCELLELYSVAFCMRDIAEWAAAADSTNLFNSLSDIGDLAHASGPAKLLGAYLSGCSYSLRDLLGDDSFEDYEESPLIQGYILWPLREILEHRNAKQIDENETHLLSILDNIHHQAKDPCTFCDNECGFDLWNETNWEYLRGVIPLESLSRLLIGQLSSNVIESERFRILVSNPTFTYTTFLRELHQERYHGQGWRRRDWLCKHCIVQLFRSYTWAWLLRQNKKKGIEIPEDCVYGYACKAQDNKIHAETFNHLCTTKLSS
ncbi:hypothetical protein Hypma_016314 [Hypsizygus marmoreus]|uniref:Aprataxin and PNK-like factor PBZ domain-containing protein n=1 Tax=Hypsizygus marmoreus TaxID=39966 RepID=A0A369IXQ3_HYPMA|nr:hypothetical protein Hypma_016314 [Hypsizygus marmoreus]